MPAGPSVSAPGARERSLGATLRGFVASLSPARRRDLLVGAVVMLFGAVAELVTIGSLLTFLQLLAAPNGANELPGFGWFISLVGGGEGGNLVAKATILLISAAMLSAAARLFILWTTQNIVLRIGHELAVAIFSGMLRQPYSFHISRNPSELYASVEKVQAITFGGLLPLIQGLVATVIAVAIIALLVAIDPFGALLAALAIGFVYFAVSLFTERRLKSNSAIINEAATARMKAIQEGVGGIRDILLGHTQARFEAHYREVDARYRRAQAINMFIAAGPRYVVEAAAIVVIGLLALFLSLQPGGIVAAIPKLGALALGAQRLLPLLQQAYGGWSNFAGKAKLFADVLQLVQARVATDESARSQERLPFSRDIVFDQVSLSYPERPNALQSVSFTISKGARLGIMGPSGSGKSSLLDVLTALLEPTSGEIRVDGRSITHENRSGWQRHVAHVPQTVYLPDTSIAACIAFGEPGPDVDLERVEQAARGAHLHDFIMSLPARYGTQVGERGVRLSGGQRQRIAIARALYKQASLLIFDEATGALDQKTERDVMDSIDCLGRDITVLVVSHRLSALRGCDSILVIEEGRVAAIRSFEDLAAEVQD